MADTHLVTFQVTYRIPVDIDKIEDYPEIAAGLYQLPEDVAAGMVIDDYERNEAEFLIDVALFPESYGVTHVEKIGG